jgi:hypothetical protein
MQKPIWLIVALCLAGRSLAQDDEILAIQAADLPKLWTKSRGDDEGEYYGRLKYRAGCATVSWIVESDGTISTIKVLKAWPNEQFGEVTSHMLREWRYEPTAGNPTRQAVYLVDTFISTIAQADRELGSNIKRTIDLKEIASHCAIRGVKFGE